MSSNQASNQGVCKTFISSFYPFIPFIFSLVLFNCIVTLCINTLLKILSVAHIKLTSLATKKDPHVEEHLINFIRTACIR